MEVAVGRCWKLDRRRSLFPPVHFIAKSHGIGNPSSSLQADWNCILDRDPGHGSNGVREEFCRVERNVVDELGLWDSTEGTATEY